jgi:hypothetical protein
MARQRPKFSSMKTMTPCAMNSHRGELNRIADFSTKPQGFLRPCGRLIQSTVCSCGECSDLCPLPSTSSNKTKLPARSVTRVGWRVNAQTLHLSLRSFSCTTPHFHDRIRSGLYTCACGEMDCFVARAPRSEGVRPEAAKRSPCEARRRKDPRPSLSKSSYGTESGGPPGKAPWQVPAHPSIKAVFHTSLTISPRLGTLGGRSRVAWRHSS